MSRDGLGTYNLPAGNPVVSGTTIGSSWANTTLQDIAAALTGSIAADGQTAMTNALNMGGFNFSNVALATAGTHVPRASQVQTAEFLKLGTVTGTNTVTATLPLAPAAFVAGQLVTMVPANANTGAVTLAINSGTAYAIQRINGSALSAGELQASVPTMLMWSGTAWLLLTQYGYPTFRGDMTIGAATPQVYNATANRTYLALLGRGTGLSDSSGNIQLIHNRATDSDATVMGNLEWIDPLQSVTNKRMGYIAMQLNGSTALNRGADMSFATRPDASSAAVEVMRLGRSNTNELVFSIGGYSTMTGTGYFGIFGNGTRSVIVNTWGNNAANSAHGYHMMNGTYQCAMLMPSTGDLVFCKQPTGFTDALIAASEAMRINGGGASNLTLTLTGSLNNTMILAGTGVGTVQFSTAVARIAADMSNATLANRLAFQNTVANASSFVGVIPNGSGTAAGFTAHAGSDPDNAASLSIRSTAAAATINSSKSGTGVTQDLVLQTNGTTALTIDKTTQALTVANVVKSYNGVALVAGGVPTTPARDRKTAQAAALAAVSLGNVAADGMYRVSFAASVTQAATTSSTLGGTNGFTVTATDPQDSVAKTTKSGLAATLSTGNTTATTVGQSMVVYAKSGTAITYSYDYTSSGATPMQFDIAVIVEYLGAAA